MSDTTKINKARVNGVLYDLGGGSGSSGVSGAYLAPGCLVQADYYGFEEVTIDPLALIEQLEKAGVNVDEPPFLDENETEVSFNLGVVEFTDFRSTPVVHLMDTMTYIDFFVDKGGRNSIAIGCLGDGQTALNVGDFRTDSIRTLILAAFEYFLNNDMEIVSPLVPADSQTTVNVSNIITIRYDAIGDQLHYFIPDMTEFCSTALVEYTSGSSSASVVSEIEFSGDTGIR